MISHNKAHTHFDVLRVLKAKTADKPNEKDQKNKYSASSMNVVNAYYQTNT